MVPRRASSKWYLQGVLLVLRCLLKKWYLQRGSFGTAMGFFEEVLATGYLWHRHCVLSSGTCKGFFDTAMGFSEVVLAKESLWYHDGVL